MYRLLMILAAMLMYASGVSAQKTDWAKFDRYAEANREVQADPDNKRRVVFYGNSITQFWASKRPAFFESNGFIGRGIAGQTTYQFLSRFREDVVNLHPRLVVINAATNDIAENSHPYDEQRTLGNIKSMVEIARANGIRVILTSTLPAAGFSWNKEIKHAPEKIAALNRLIAEYARQEKIPYVDYHSQMLDEDGRRLSRMYTEDGVHPTVAGYEVMEALILPCVRKIVK